MKTLEKEKYFNNTRLVSEATKKFLIEYTKKYKYFNMNSVWKKRILNSSQHLLRPNIVKNSISIFHPQINWKKKLDIISFVELFNISTYQADRVFDQHYAIDTKDEEYFEYINSYLTFTLGFNLIEKSILKQDAKVILLSYYNTAMNKVYEGQYQDIFLMHKKNNSAIVLLPENDYLKEYFLRCTNFDGYQISLCFLAGLLNDILDKELASSLETIGLYYGVCLQILNDLFDLLPSNQKSFLEDAVENKITYPIYLLLQDEEGKVILKDLWNNININKKEHEVVNKYKFKFIKILSKESIHLKIYTLLFNLYKEIDKEIKFLQSKNYNTSNFNFIFPNIFLSRILVDYNMSKNLTNQMANHFKRNKYIVKDISWIKTLKKL